MLFPRQSPQLCGVLPGRWKLIDFNFPSFFTKESAVISFKRSNIQIFFFEFRHPNENICLHIASNSLVIKTTTVDAIKTQLLVSICIGNERKKHSLFSHDLFIVDDDNLANWQRKFFYSFSVVSNYPLINIWATIKVFGERGEWRLTWIQIEVHWKRKVL